MVAASPTHKPKGDHASTPSRPKTTGTVTITPVYILAGILSLPHSHHLRNMRRGMWLHSALYECPSTLDYRFVISRNDPGAKLLEAEQRAHKDLLIVNVPTGYDFLSYKVKAFVDWAVGPTARPFTYLLKADDDCVFCLRGLLAELSMVRKAQYFGKLKTNAPVILDPSSHSANPRFAKEVGVHVYPAFHGGNGYLITRSVAVVLAAKPITGDSALPFRHFPREDATFGYWMSAGGLAAPTASPSGRRAWDLSASANHKASMAAERERQLCSRVNATNNCTAYTPKAIVTINVDKQCFACGRQVNKSAVIKRTKHGANAGRGAHHAGNAQKRMSTLPLCSWFPAACQGAYEGSLRMKQAVEASVILLARAGEELKYALYALVGCLLVRAVAASRRLRALLDPAIDAMARFWSDGPALTRPAASMKLFVVLLVALDLLGLAAPEINILATPEVVNMNAHAPVPPFPIPNLVPILMPGFNEASKATWVANLIAARRTLFLTWAAYLASGPGLISGCLYGCGAVCYAYLASLGIVYNVGHSAQGPMLFVLMAIPAVAGLGKNHRAGQWLRTCLFACVLVPVYLFSGVSKLRYMELDAHVTGAWLTDMFKVHKSRAGLPWLNDFVQSVPLLHTLLSWGNVVVEVLLPVACLLLLHSTSRIATLSRALFLAGLVGFHVSIYLLMGPNFLRNCVLCLLAADPLSLYGESRADAGHAKDRPLTSGDWLRGVVAVAIQLCWLCSQLDACWSAANGVFDNAHHHNHYWPWPELSMYSEPTTHTYPFLRHGTAAAFLLLLAAKVARRMLGWQGHEDARLRISAPESSEQASLQGSASPHSASPSTPTASRFGL